MASIVCASNHGYQPVSVAKWRIHRCQPLLPDHFLPMQLLLSVASPWQHVGHQSGEQFFSRMMHHSHQLGMPIQANVHCYNGRFVRTIYFSIDYIHNSEQRFTFACSKGNGIIFVFARCVYCLLQKSLLNALHTGIDCLSSSLSAWIPKANINA